MTIDLNPYVRAPVTRRLLAVLTLVLGLAGGGAGCGHPRVAAPADPAPADPAAAEAMAVLPDGDRAVIRPGLMVDVTVLAGGKKQIEESGRRVSEEGTLTLPLVGPLPVNDETLESLGRRLTRLYAEYFVNPQVMVDFVRDVSPDAVSPWGSVTVMGRVRRPGRVNIPPTRDLTVSQAIQLAGGFDTSAKETAIRVTRRDTAGTVTTREVNLQAVGARGRMENDLVLTPDDVVYVPLLFF